MIVTGDMNGDGHVDLISANRQTSTAAVYFGDGKGESVRARAVTPSARIPWRSTSGTSTATATSTS